MSRKAPPDQEGLEQESGTSEQTSEQTENSSEQCKQSEEQQLDEDLDQRIDAEGSYRISQRDFDHPASAGFRYRQSSGQQFWFGEERCGPYIKRGHRKTKFR